MPLNIYDQKKVASLLQSTFIKNNPLWAREIEYMVQQNKKVEIQAIEGLDKGFLGKYVQTKIASSIYIAPNHWNYWLSNIDQ